MKVRFPILCNRFVFNYCQNVQFVNEKNTRIIAQICSILLERIARWSLSHSVYYRDSFTLLSSSFLRQLSARTKRGNDIRSRLRRLKKCLWHERDSFLRLIVREIRERSRNEFARPPSLSLPTRIYLHFAHLRVDLFSKISRGRTGYLPKRRKSKRV